MSAVRAALAAVLGVAVAGCGFHWEPAFREQAAPGHLDDVVIAALDEALTFARVDDDGAEPRLVAVTSYTGGIVHGVDLGAALGRPVSDAVALLTERGWDGVRDAVRTAPAAARIAVPAARLGIPIDLPEHHIAAATNFPEHAGDAGVEDGPFLFAKSVRPTGPDAEVSAGGRLLDYEAEVAWVTFAPLPPGGDPPLVGLVLCNDFTDRDVLLRTLDPWDVTSGAGFTTGKSFPGALPIGNLLVVPRDHRRFVADLELRLWVNDALRQRAPASAMVWDFDEIVARTYAWKDRRWDDRGTQVSLLGASDVIPERTLLLSGTPHGTVFDGIQPRHYALGASAWILGGWDQPIAGHVLAAYIADARAAGIYLQPGDRVDIHVDRMGVLRTRVVE